MKENEKKAACGCDTNTAKEGSRLGKVGGEALIEGIMMKAGKKYSIALRQQDKRIRVSCHDYTTVRDKFILFRIPIIRGAVNMIESLILSYKVLGVSADAFGEEVEEEPSKFEKWLDEKFGKSIIDIVMVIGGVLGIVLGLGLFFYLPMLCAKGLEMLFGPIGWFKNLLEGVIRIAIFVGYVWAVAHMNDIRRTFQYHGAEHKTIFCYEAELPLTVENVRKQSRFHPRCGTSFIFVALILSVIISSFITWDNMALRFGIKLLLLPFTVGISYEFIKYAGKHDNILTKILSAPGLWMQRLTTVEPDDDQIEVAIASVKVVLSEEFPELVTEPVEGQTYRLVAEDAPADNA